MKPSEIAKIAQIASALEVSGYPKPGNVHRTRNYDDMAFEDLYSEQYKSRNDLRGMKFYNSIDEHPFLKKFKNDDHDVNFFKYKIYLLYLKTLIKF